jgi:hypothetical protein
MPCEKKPGKKRGDNVTPLRKGSLYNKPKSGLSLAFGVEGSDLVVRSPDGKIRRKKLDGKRQPRGRKGGDHNDPES